MRKRIEEPKLKAITAGKRCEQKEYQQKGWTPLKGPGSYQHMISRN